MHYCTVIINSKSKAIANGLTYFSDIDTVQKGMLVRVPLRKSVVEGIIVSVQTKKPEADFDFKEIKELRSNTPLLPLYCISTAKWMAEKYFCSLRQALQPFLPSKNWSDLLPKTATYVSLAGADTQTFDLKKIQGKRQTEVLEYLFDEEWVSLEKLRREIGTPMQTLKRMEKSGILLFDEKEDFSENRSLKFLERPNLSNIQKVAYDKIQKSDKPCLLFGITSSGKTEIYTQRIADVVENGKQAILLVPEILLTEQNIVRFQERLSPERIAVVHSRLTAAERKNIWRKCRSGQIDLVIGSRSALFSPLFKLGLIIIDEEHEWTYKNEQSPRYHARDTGQHICKSAGASLLLGSATPSIESWSYAKNGKYELVEIFERYKNQPMPEVTVVDLAETAFSTFYPFSPTLFSAIENTLSKKEQCILFLNRRGLATALICLSCRRRIVSAESQLPFTVHRKANGGIVLVDHTTNLRTNAPDKCPHCGSSSLHAIGAGTQKVEDILSQKFPNARLLRADSDTLTHPDHMRLLLKKMHEKRADILFGTQSVVKGLDIPHVTLAAVLLADIGLSLPHFRSGERIFQTLTQLTGRSGRFRPGKVIIQTFRPNCPEVSYSANHKTKEYLDSETALREKLGYPPFTKMIRLIFRKPNPQQRANAVYNELIKNKKTEKISLSPTLFGGGNVWHILIRGNNPKSLLINLNLYGASIDIDPIDCI